MSEALHGALLGGLAATAATAVGALPALAWREISRRTEGLRLGFAAVLMLSASAYTLIVPAIDAGAQPFVVSHEMIPETHRGGQQMPATLGVILEVPAQA
ncbi:MAG TPA: hypothetical protein VF876_01005 [Burkholderiales bacterium]